MTDRAMIAAARAACIADGGAPDADWVGYEGKREWQAYVESTQAAITAWLAALDDQTVLAMAVAMFNQDHDESWVEGEQLTKNIYVANARAALKTLQADSG